MKEVEEGVWEIKAKFEAGQPIVSVHTYEDHRMAMAFAPLCTQQEIIIEDPEVVNKSYPSFWEHLAMVAED